METIFHQIGLEQLWNAKKMKRAKILGIDRNETNDNDSIDKAYNEHLIECW